MSEDMGAQQGNGLTLEALAKLMEKQTQRLEGLQRENAQRLETPERVNPSYVRFGRRPASKRVLRNFSGKSPGVLARNAPRNGWETRDRYGGGAKRRCGQAGRSERL